MKRATDTLTPRREHSIVVSSSSPARENSRHLNFLPGKSRRWGRLRYGSWAKRVYRKILADNCFGQAAQLAYYFLFALFPFLLFLTTLLAYIPVPQLLDQIMNLLTRALPGEALSLVQDHVHTLVSQQRSGLLSFGIIAALWTASSAILAIADGINHAYDVEESRPWWKVRGMAMLLVIGLSLFMIAATVLLIFGPQLGSWIANGVGLGEVFALTWNIARWPVSIVLLMFGLALLYYVAPDAKQSWRWVTPGSVVVVVGWIITSLGFSYYVTNFASYNATYGSIGTVIVLLTWLYLIGVFILIGGEVNAAFDYASGDEKTRDAK
jgi:membrane protein